MKKNFTRWAAMALAVVLVGCSAPRTEITLVDAPEQFPQGASLTLVDHTPERETIPHRMENPSAMDDGVFVDVANVSAVNPPSIIFPDAPRQNTAPSNAVGRNAWRSPNPVTGEVRAVWISFLEYDTILMGRTQEQFTANIRGMFDNLHSFGFNTVIVQVRPFGDALYRSQLFPWSRFATGTEGRDPGFDPLEIMVREARARNFRIEAWVNPYRIRPAGNRTPMSSNNPAVQMMNDRDGSVIQYNGIISYNPSSQRARNLIVNGIVEIVRNYDIDAIHIDDYFYPTTSPGFDRAFYNAYINAGGRMGLADWRRNNVELLLREIYTAIKREDPTVLFGISPQANIDNNFNEQYIDVRKILSQPGFLDYIAPQIYFGFRNQAWPFERTLRIWNDMITVDGIELIIGLGPYKIGLHDTWAGTGANEWLNTTTIMRDKVQMSRGVSNYNGFAMFRYDSMFRPSANVRAQVEREMANLRPVMNTGR